MTIHIRHHPADATVAADGGNRPLVSTLWLITLGVLWLASLIALPLLVWHSLLLPAILSAVLAATLPFGAGLLVSGLAIHRRVAHSLDAIVRLLLAASSVATPIARRIHHTPVVASVVTGVLKVSFFAWFTGLVLTDRVLRRVLGKLAGKHVATSRHFSLVNAPDPCFQPAGIFSDVIDEEDGAQRPPSPEAVATSMATAQDEQQQTSDMLLRAQGIPFRPKTAYSMAMAAKLAYEDLVIVRHELEAAGYDMETFQPIHYRNTCGFVVAKGRKIIVIFRGTAPLNAANILTDIRHHMCPAAEPTSGVEMGQVHEGFLDALGPVEHLDDDDEPNLVPFDIGSPDPFLPPTSAAALAAAAAGGSISKRTGKRLASGGGHRRTRSTATGGSTSTRRRLVRQTRKLTRSRTIRLELHAHSLTSALVSSVRALATVTDVVVRQVAKHVSDPIERFTHVDNREESAYVQAHRAIAACLAKMQVRERMVGVVKRHREDLVRQMREKRRESGRQRYGEWGVETSDDAASMCSGVSRDEGPRVVYRMHRSDSGMDARLRHEGLDSSSSSSSSSSEEKEDVDVTFSSDEDDDQDSGPIRLYVGGHSLGGAVAHVFLAKLAECNSAFLDLFDGLYTFGSPRVGDADFQAYLDARFNNLFRIVYNKDIVPRVPPINPYAELPGHLVTLSPLGKMVFRPPGTVTRPVNFISPSGLLSPTVIFQLRNESFLRFVYRILLPFYVNDHMPADYVAALQKYAY